MFDGERTASFATAGYGAPNNNNNSTAFALNDLFIQVQCVATAHFYHFNDVECSDDAHGFSELFGSPLPPSILDAYAIPLFLL